MSKPELTIIDGGKIEAVELPEREDFACWKCGNNCVIWPRAEPPSVQHSLPACSEWQRIETGAEDLERFAIKCGVELLIAKGKA